MKQFKKINKFILSVIVFCFIQNSVNAKAIKNDMMQEEYYDLASEEVENLKTAALLGNVEASWKLWEYYELAKYDYSEAEFWEIIICENELNENAEGTYNYAVSLVNQKNTEDRGWYWLYRCKQAGYVYNEFLQNLYKQADSKIKQYMPINKTTEFSKMEISEIERSANIGNGDAAYYLYKKYFANKSTEEYGLSWLRIGAQNGSLKCIKEFCKYLENSRNKNEKLRAEFWRKQLE